MTKFMKKRTKLVAAVIGLVIMSAIPAYAAGWQWLDRDDDGTKECYYIEDNGTILTSTTTPDGYQVNEQGAWITDGIVQTQKDESASYVVKTSAKIEAGSMKTSQLDKFQYWLYTPKNATENMPLIVYLHGHGKNNFNELKINNVFDALCTNAKNVDGAYILTPFLPPELDYGYKGMWPGIEDSIIELIEAVAADKKIDRSRISIIGLSMGADAALQIAPNHPEVFSCITAIIPFHYKCPIVKWETSWGESLKTVPVWFFMEDETSAIQLAEAAKDDITAAGGEAWINIQTGKDHGESGAYTALNMKNRNYGVYNWMISVTRPQQ